MDMGSPPHPASTLDAVLTAQIAVAWAGEGGDEPRLSWWRTDLASEFGGEDLFQRLVPSTWRWAVLQAVREAARRHDTERRKQGHDADRLLTLFHHGPEVDGLLDERLQDLKRSGRAPTSALPGLQEVMQDDWDATSFEEWLSARAPVATVTSPSGRRLRGEVPASLEHRSDKLLAALLPLAGQYPLPHFRGPA
jgi:hypothetical protein